MDDKIFSIFQIPMGILKIFGLWTNEKSSAAYKVYGIIVQILFIDLYALCMVIYLAKFKDVVDFAELMSFLPVYISCAIKSVNFMLHVDEIEELFAMIRDCVQEFDISENFQKQFKTVDRIYKMFWGGATFICFNVTIATITAHKLPYRMWIPFDINTATRFWLIAIHENLDGFCAAGENFFK